MINKWRIVNKCKQNVNKCDKTWMDMIGMWSHAITTSKFCHVPHNSSLCFFIFFPSSFLFFHYSGIFWPFPAIGSCQIPDKSWGEPDRLLEKKFKFTCRAGWAEVGRWIMIASHDAQRNSTSGWQWLTTPKCQVYKIEVPECMHQAHCTSIESKGLGLKGKLQFGFTEFWA